MAKDIRECLLEQARKFHQWQEITYPGKTTEEIGGAWAVSYTHLKGAKFGVSQKFNSRRDLIIFMVSWT